jgi:hypothetical protein
MKVSGGSDEVIKEKSNKGWVKQEQKYAASCLVNCRLDHAPLVSGRNLRSQASGRKGGPFLQCNRRERKENNEHASIENKERTMTFSSCEEEC